MFYNKLLIIIFFRILLCDIFVMFLFIFVFFKLVLFIEGILYFVFVVIRFYYDFIFDIICLNIMFCIFIYLIFLK